jgi:iron-sulfur cluster repair protein YtfE (RIC family)
MSLFQQFKKDHQRIATLFKTLSQTTTKALKTRNEMFRRLKEELETHSSLEEDIFYAMLSCHKEAETIVKKAKQDHKEAKKRLKELTRLPRNEEEWGKKLDQLRKKIEHHVREEEDQMFPKARKLLSDEQLEDMASRIEEERKEMAESVK